MGLAETMRRVALLFLLEAAYALGQKSPVPYAQDSDGRGPTFTSEDVSLSYRGSYSSIRNVNFLNFRVFILDEAGKPAGSVLLKKGDYKCDEPFSHFSMDSDSIYFLSTSLSSKRSSALVLYQCSAAGGSSSQGTTAQVFTVSDGHLRLVQEIRWDTHFQADQPTNSFDASTNTLVIRSAHYIPGDAHCCVSATDIVTFKWDGIRLVQSGIQTELSKYGKKEGKTLPR